MSAARTDDTARPSTARPEPRSSWTYWLPGIGVILASALAIGLIVRAEWHRILDEVAATSTTLASVLADHTDRLFESADLIRLQVEEIVGAADPIEGDRGRHEQLARLVDAVPHITSIWVGDAEGMAVSTSRDYPTPALSAADRPYFTRVRDDPDAFFTGTLTDNRYVDEVLINTSRRLATEDGSFRGFIQIGINPINMRRTFAHVRLPYQTALWLFNAEGAPLMHEPFIPSDRLAAAVPRDVDIGALTGSGIFRALSGVDGIHRRYFYTQSPQYGAYVLIALQDEELRARWRERALPIVGIGGLLVVALAAILLFVHRERTSGLRWAVALEREVEERTAELVEVSRARELVVQELRHRVRNSFTLIQALSRQMLASATDLAALKRDFPDRLAALAATQVLLVESDDRNSALLDELVWTELAPYRSRDDAQITVEGPPTALAARKVTALGMLLHELATNAVKHGALAVPEGRLTVRWSVVDEPRTLCLEWLEDGCATIAEGPRKGFGSEVLERTAKLLQAELDLDLTPDGMKARLRMPR
jgi:two-component sensor histidine kinase